MQRFWQKNVCKNQVSTTRNIGFMRIEVKVAEKLKKMRYHYLQNRLPKSSQQLRN
jgi:viroplasmin and RNaseH domain-containing protein